MLKSNLIVPSLATSLITKRTGDTTYDTPSESREDIKAPIPYCGLPMPTCKGSGNNGVHGTDIALPIVTPGDDTLSCTPLEGLEFLEKLSCYGPEPELLRNRIGREADIGSRYRLTMPDNMEVMYDETDKPEEAKKAKLKEGYINAMRMLGI